MGFAHLLIIKTYFDAICVDFSNHITALPPPHINNHAYTMIFVKYMETDDDKSHHAG